MSIIEVEDMPADVISHISTAFIVASVGEIMQKHPLIISNLGRVDIQNVNYNRILSGRAVFSSVAVKQGNISMSAER